MQTNDMAAFRSEEKIPGVLQRAGQSDPVPDSRFAIHSRFKRRFGPLQRNRDFPRQHVAAEPIHDRHQINKALPQANVGDIAGPNVIGPIDLEAAQPIRIDLVS